VLDKERQSDGPDYFVSGYSPRGGFCEYLNKMWGAIKYGQFLDHLATNWKKHVSVSTSQMNRKRK
jgi:hypothetical protein